MKHSKDAGFTVIAALIVVAIFGLLLAIAAPPLTDFLNEVQARQNTNEFLSSLLLARSEAVTRNRPVSMCKIDASTLEDCDSDNAWHDGWLSFEDLDEDGVLDVGEEIIDQHAGLDDTTIITTVNFSDHLTYTPSGRVSSAGAFNLCVGHTSASRIGVNATGRPRIVEGVCTD